MKNVVIFFKNIFCKLNELFILNLLFKFLIILGQKNRLILWKGSNFYIIYQIKSLFSSFRSHGLTLKNELILSMIEKNSDWERILTENIIQFDEEVRTLWLPQQLERDIKIRKFWKKIRESRKSSSSRHTGRIFLRWMRRK
jgi:hypothetical protein